MAERPPGPPNPPMIPGHLGTPSREKLDAMAATISMFDWLEANGMLEGEVKRLHTAWAWEYEPTARRWLDQADPPPSWKQMADLLTERDTFAAENKRLKGALNRIANMTFPTSLKDPPDLASQVQAFAREALLPTADEVRGILKQTDTPSPADAESVGEQTCPKCKGTRKHPRFIEPSPPMGILNWTAPGHLCFDPFHGTGRKP